MSAPTSVFGFCPRCYLVRPGTVCHGTRDRPHDDEELRRFINPPRPKRDKREGR